MIGLTPLMRAIVPVLYAITFVLYIISPTLVEGVVLAFYLVLVVISILIPIYGRGKASDNVHNYQTLVISQGMLCVLSVSLIFLTLATGINPSKYAAEAAILFATLFLSSIAPLRLARLGQYLKENGTDALDKRSPFQTRDDHFFLDYSVGHFFRHASFAILYISLGILYFIGWFLVGTYWLLPATPLLVAFFPISKRLARFLLRPYDPENVATKIEAIYPATSIKRISANPPLVLMSFLYIVAVEYFVSDRLVAVLLLISYFAPVMYLRFVRTRHSHSDKRGKGGGNHLAGNDLSS